MADPSTHRELQDGTQTALDPPLFTDENCLRSKPPEIHLGR